MVPMDKPILAVSMIGDANVGMYNISSQLAAELVDKRMQSKLAQLQDQRDKSSSAFSHFFDKPEQERQRGVAIGASIIAMANDRFRVQCFDGSGHAAYLENVGSGCKQPDLTVVVVSADPKASCWVDGKLQTQLTVAAALGSDRFVVCIDKLDETVGKKGQPPETIFDATLAKVLRMIQKLVPERVPIFLPISTLGGVGLSRNKSRFDFFKGQKVPLKHGIDTIVCLEDAIHYQDTPDRPNEKPLRLTISSVHHVPGQGTIFCGAVHYGQIKKGDQIKFLPTDTVAEVTNVQAHKVDVAAGVAGMNVGFIVRPKDKGSPTLEKIKVGHVVGPAESENFSVSPFYLAECTSLKPKPTNGAPEKGIRAGYTPAMECGLVKAPCTVMKMMQAMDPGDTRRDGDMDIALKDQKFRALIYPTKPSVFECNNDFPGRGGLVWTDSNILVAVGQTVEKVSESQARDTYGISQEILNIQKRLQTGL